MKQIDFTKEKLYTHAYISKTMLADLNFQTSQQSDDFINDQLTIKLTGYIYTNLSDERELEYFFDKPTFFDWLFGRKRKAKFNLKVKDILLNPPQMKGTVRMYVTEPIN